MTRSADVAPVDGRDDGEPAIVVDGSRDLNADGKPLRSREPRQIDTRDSQSGLPPVEHGFAGVIKSGRRLTRCAWRQHEIEGSDCAEVVP